MVLCLWLLVRILGYAILKLRDYHLNSYSAEVDVVVIRNASLSMMAFLVIGPTLLAHINAEPWLTFSAGFILAVAAGLSSPGNAFTAIYIIASFVYTMTTSYYILYKGRQSFLHEVRI